MEVTQIFKNKQQEFIDLARKKMKSEKINRFVGDNYSKFKSKLRKVMTGDEKIRVRDHMMNSQGTTENFILFDKLAFTVGVLNLMMCEFCFTNTPGYFWIFYIFVMTISIVSRYLHFKSLNWEYFMLDFCYFALVCNMIAAIFFPEGNWFFRVSYIFANGPLPWAIVVWRNSYVFHDYDRMFSVYIHILPSMLSYVGLREGHCYLRSLLPSTECEVTEKSCHMMYCHPPAIVTVPTLGLQDFGLAILGYILWQTVYFIKTEVIDKEYLNAHPEKVTSLRWLAADVKNPLARYVLRKLRKVGVFGPAEDYDSKTVKTKIVFMTTQGVYSVMTFLPSFAFYRWPGIQFGFIVFVIIIAIYNGAGYYFEVFSARYQREVAKHTVPGKRGSKSPQKQSQQQQQQQAPPQPIIPKVSSKEALLPVPVAPLSPTTTKTTGALSSSSSVASSTTTSKESSPHEHDGSDRESFGSSRDSGSARASLELDTDNIHRDGDDDHHGRDNEQNNEDVDERDLAGYVSDSPDTPDLEIE